MNQILETPDMIINPYRFGGGGGGAITFVGYADASATNGNPLSIDLTGIVGLAEDDLVICFGGFINQGGSAPGAAGYTDLFTAIDNGEIEFWAGYKFMGVTPDTSITPVHGTGGTKSTVYGAVVLRGVHASVTDATPTTDNGVSAGTSVYNQPSITTVTDDAWVLAIGCTGRNDVFDAAPSGYSNYNKMYQSESQGYGVASATFEKSPAGVETTPDFGTGGGTEQFWIAATIALKPA